MRIEVEEGESYGKIVDTGQKHYQVARSDYRYSLFITLLNRNEGTKIEIATLQMLWVEFNKGVKLNTRLCSEAQLTQSDRYLRSHGIQDHIKLNVDSKILIEGKPEEHIARVLSVLL